MSNEEVAREMMWPDGNSAKRLEWVSCGGSRDQQGTGTGSGRDRGLKSKGAMTEYGLWMGGVDTGSS